jgi:hypothetical protein
MRGRKKKGKTEGKDEKGWELWTGMTEAPKQGWRQKRPGVKPLVLQILNFFLRS